MKCCMNECEMHQEKYVLFPKQAGQNLGYVQIDQWKNFIVLKNYMPAKR